MSGALRFVLVLMLSLAIPAYGFAGLSAQQAPCPMAHVDTEPESAAPLHHGDIDAEVDCCAGQDDSAGTDQTCEMSQDCAGVHAVHLPETTGFAASLAAVRASPSLDSGWLVRHPHSIWRPTAAL